jgi:non-ribosomal peptide synthetase component F
VLPPATLALARQVSREHGTTLYVTLLAAITAVMHRYAGAEDIGVASPVTGRAMPELEGLIGYFPNVLVMRTALSAEQPFSALLRATRDTVSARSTSGRHWRRRSNVAARRHWPVAFALQGESTSGLTLPGPS